MFTPREANHRSKKLFGVISFNWKSRLYMTQTWILLLSGNPTRGAETPSDSNKYPQHVFLGVNSQKANLSYCSI